MTHDERRTRRCKIAQMIAAGKTVSQVRLKFGVSYTTVYSACEENGVSFTTITQDERRERRRLAAESIAKGRDISDVCRELNVSSGYVLGACCEFGVKRPSMKGVSVDTFVILKHLADGLTVAQITDICKVSGQYVRQIADRAIEAGWTVPGIRTRKRKSAPA
jgi:hypothetical protein